MIGGRQARSTNDQRGFALIEVLIASAVVVVVLGALFAGVIGALRADRRAETMQRSLLLAHSKLEMVGIAEPLQAGVREGDVDGLHWKQVSTRLESDATAANQKRSTVVASAAASPPLSKLYWVELSVGARDGTQLSLAGLKISIAK
jgi:prepilin-type N-terminal cleavage/methylation domain-containing protein